VTVIDRPDVDFDAVQHVYEIGGQRVAGVSSVAKIGGAEDSFGIASGWGFRVGYEGAWTYLQENGLPGTKDELREALKAAKLTPWSIKDRAAERGSAVHDALEELAQHDTVPVPDKFAPDEQGHVRSVLKWYLHYRPRFVATEVQVASRTHLFAGRYDLRLLIDARRLLPLIDPPGSGLEGLREDPQALRIREMAAAADASGLPLGHSDAMALCLVDLKTSKRIYPETHFPQLSGYELAGVEMGFPPTDCQIVLNTNEDGSFTPLPVKNEWDEWSADMAVSWSQPEDFVGLLAAYRTIKRLKEADPVTKAEARREGVLIAQLPSRSSAIAALELPELAGMSSRSIGAALGKLAKKGKAVKGERGLWLPAEDA
jgi:hypothetical protein